MAQWEYKIVRVDYVVNPGDNCLTANDMNEYIEIMNDLGADGWEHYQTFSYHEDGFDVLYFKRSFDE